MIEISLMHRLTKAKKFFTNAAIISILIWLGGCANSHMEQH